MRIFIAGLFAMAFAFTAYAAQSLQTISVAESNILINENKTNPDFVVLDVRTPGEYAQGHLKQSKLMNFRGENFEEELGKLDKSKTYLIYCRSGGRSGMALKLMEKLEFESVYNMGGGFNDWSRAEFPFEK